jgi:dihydrofolate reductase
MSNVILYIACSLDGYIADPDGGIDWLTAFDDASEDYGYAAFLSHVGAIIMGGKTYRQVLGFESWPYQGIPCHIVTRQPLTNPPDAAISAFSGDVALLVEQVRRTTDKDIWLVGGAQLVTQFANAHLIDEYIVSIIPLLLGDGIPLFQGLSSQHKLTLTGSSSYANGIVQLQYR